MVHPVARQVIQRAVPAGGHPGYLRPPEQAGEPCRSRRRCRSRPSPASPRRSRSTLQVLSRDVGSRRSPSVMSWRVWPVSARSRSIQSPRRGRPWTARPSLQPGAEMSTRGASRRGTGLLVAYVIGRRRPGKAQPMALRATADTAPAAGAGPLVAKAHSRRALRGFPLLQYGGPEDQGSGDRHRQHGRVHRACLPRQRSAAPERW